MPRRMGDIARMELSERQSISNSGGRCKWYNVSGVMVQGTWERDIATKMNEFGIKWIKSKTKEHSFKYIHNNKIKTYSPDFYLPEYNLYLEVKGYWWGNDKEKMMLVLNQHPNINIILIEKEEYKRIMGGELVWLIQRLFETQ